jgi:glycosyltransferase involved in cell wall biosynthesis
MPGAEFWILGSGPALEPLRHQVARLRVESRVKLVGQVPSSDIPSWLRRCDAGVLPIRRDVFLDFAFPNKLPEFIVNGKAVIVSRLRTIRHYFSEAALVYFEPGNPADLAAQMIAAYRDPPLRLNKAAVAAQEYAPITWDVMRDRYLTVVKASVAARDPVPVVAS